MSVVWHELECGAYAADLPLWRELAEEHGGPILDIGAGTGRVALDLARHGYEVTALDRDEDLLDELSRRARDLKVQTQLADARAFELGRRFALCLVPMQTIQLLSPDARTSFLRLAREHLRADGVLAAALTAELTPYDVADGGPVPLPDMFERDGTVYSSSPTAIRVDDSGYVLERRREAVTANGERSCELNAIRLERLGPEALEREGAAVGFQPLPRRWVPATVDYVGSVVVMFRA